MSTPYPPSTMIPSMISNEPPPLDSTSEDEDSSEEFRTPGLKLDLATSAEPSPLSTPRKTGKEGGNKANKSIVENGHSRTKEEEVELPDEVDHQATSGDRDNLKDSYIGEVNKGQQEQGKKQECVSDSETNSHEAEENDEEFHDVSSSMEDAVLKEEDLIVEQGASTAEQLQLSVDLDGSGEEKQNQVPIDVTVASHDSFEDFVAPKEVLKTTVVPDGIEGDEDSEDDFADFIETPALPKEERIPEEAQKLQEANNEFEDDDDFGDFECTSAPLSARPSVDSNIEYGSSTIHQENEDTFADFQDFEESSAPIIPPSMQQISSPRNSADFTAALESKFDSLIKTLIPNPEEGESFSSDDAPMVVLDKVLQEENDPCWSHTLDFENSRSLLHKWPHCTYQQRLYQSLKIDTSNIIYTEKWGAIEVPKFAASMVETPILQPQVCTSSKSNADDENKSENINRHPSPPSENINRHPSPPSEDNRNLPNGKPLSLEAQQILQSLPDWSYMLSKTLVYPQGMGPSKSKSNGPP